MFPLHSVSSTALLLLKLQLVTSNNSTPPNVTLKLFMLLTNNPVNNTMLDWFVILPCIYLVCVQDLQKGFVDVRLTLEAVLDLVDIVYSMVELNRLVVLERWSSRRRAAHRSVGLYWRWARWGIGWDGWIGLAGRCMGWRLNWLLRTKGLKSIV